MNYLQSHYRFIHFKLCRFQHSLDILLLDCCLLLFVRCAVDFTGEEIKLYDCGEEVSSSSNNQRAEVPEAAVSGEYHLPYSISTSRKRHTVSLVFVKKILHLTTFNWCLFKRCDRTLWFPL